MHCSELDSSRVVAQLWNYYIKTSEQSDFAIITTLNHIELPTQCQLMSNQLEKLEAARSAYLWLPLVTFPYLWLPFLALLGLTGLYFALLGLTGPYWTLLGLTRMP